MNSARDPIFDQFARTERQPSGHGEPTFSFLNRVAGDFWEHPRLLMQAWADRLSDAEYIDLRQRFRSRDDEQFRSAFLELYLHECLTRAGFKVTVHPEVQGTSRRPDFLAVREDMSMFIEAIAPGSSSDAKAAAGRLAVLFDTLDRLDDPNFMLCLDRLVEGSRPPAAARLRADLAKWLAQLDPDSISGLADSPAWHWTHDGWSVTFRPIPLKKESRGIRKDRRAIGIFGHHKAAIINNAPAIKAALSAKHHAYGDLDAPFVVAVGTYMFDADDWHATNALYGHSAVEFSAGPEGEMETRAVRQPDGYFGTPPDWLNNHVSGVLLVNQLMPYYVQKAETTLWLHPAARHPLPDGLGLPFRVAGVRQRGLDLTDSVFRPDEFLGLPDPWPPGEAWPED